MIDFYYDRDYDYSPFRTSQQRRASKKKMKFADIPFKSKGGTVYAVQKLNKTAFYMGEKVFINFGKARCHKEDSFIKKVGRDLAISKSVLTEFTVVRILQEEDKIFYRFKNDKHEIEIMFKNNKPVSRLDFVGEV